MFVTRILKPIYELFYEHLQFTHIYSVTQGAVCDAFFHESFLVRPSRTKSN